MDAAELKQLRDAIDTPAKRLQSLYYITDTAGTKIPFRPNYSQSTLFNNKWYFNVILKARQLGMSTFIMIYLLDKCLFTPNHAAGVIAHTREDSENLFKNKIKFAYDNLPDWLREAIPATSDSARKLEFANGSSITVGTSLRGGTFQTLHVSEYGKIAARYPEKAREIKTGALNTVHVGQEIFIESTAEGNQGEFYEVCERARKLEEQGSDLTPLDPKLHFFPWYKEPSYRLPNPEDISITADMAAYFDGLGIDLSPEQKAWYIKKNEQMGEDMKREFPSTPKEAFEMSMEGAIYVKEMSRVRTEGQIGKFPHEPSKPVYTFWDLGKGSDYTAIWFMQHIGSEYRFIDYHESWNEGWDYYAAMLSSKPYVYKEHYLPHDATTAVAGNVISTIKDMLYELGVRPLTVVPRTSNLWGDIKGKCRQTLVRCSFDERKCESGIRHLDNYRREWDDRLAQWKDKPRHDEASHACFVGETKVLTRIGTQRIMDLPQSGEVMTLCGWKRYENPRITRKSARVVEAVFASGHTVKCTQEHLFLTVKGWKSISSLPKNLETLSVSTHAFTISAKDYTNSGQAKGILREAVAGCTEMFGKKLLERFQKDATFITKMETQKTTSSRTLSVWKHLSTFSLLGEKSIATGKNILAKTLEQGQQNGTGPKKGESGTDSTLLISRGMKNGTVLTGLAIIAAKLSLWLCGSLIRKGFAGKYASLDTVEKIKKLEEERDVWCLTVPDMGHFTLENGAVVKNCDAFRTFAMGFKGRQEEFIDHGYSAVEAVHASDKELLDW